jgi:hypothetical protein
LTLYAGKSPKVQALVSRDKQLMTLTLAMPKPSQAVRLSVRDAATASKWLDAAA